RYKTTRHVVKKSTVEATTKLLAKKKTKKGSDAGESTTGIPVEENPPEATDESQKDDSQEQATPEKPQSHTRVEETESVEAQASSLESATFSVVRERVARKGTYDSSWYTSCQSENLSIQPASAKGQESQAPSPSKKVALQKDNQMDTKSNETPKDKAVEPHKTLLKRKVFSIDHRKV
ncbi:hypothetical protein XU18_3142, partial [Perkinsela sp. CCAP 1560/4]